MIATLAFYVFAAVSVASAFMVVVSRNPVYSVFYLILAFFSSAGLFVLLGAEFLALILVVVYVGAVAVLFLFVVMMLDIDLAEIRSGFSDYLPVGLLVGVVLLAELFLVFGAMSGAEDGLPPIVTAPMPAPETLENTKALASVIYTQYVWAFQAAGIILLIAMIGAIVLTLRDRPRGRKQVIADQIARKRDEVLAVRKVEPGQGV